MHEGARAWSVRAVVFVFIFAGLWALITSCTNDWCLVFEWQKVRATHTFEECVARGFPVMESYPRQCRSGDRVFREDAQPIPPGAGVEGRVVVGPTCPVARLGNNDPACADRPYATTLTIAFVDGRIVGEVQSDAAGRFRIDLVPGQYIIFPYEKEARSFPRLTPTRFLVEEGEYTYLNVVFDSGIR